MIIVIGDAMLDHYYFGKVNRISPEAPCVIFDSEREKTVLGGAANVARRVWDFGEDVTLISKAPEKELQTDSALSYSYLLSQCEGLVHKAIAECVYGEFPVKTRFMVGQQQLFRHDSEKRKPIDYDAVAKIVDIIDETVVINKIRPYIILSDYHKGVLTPFCLDEIYKICAKHSIPVFIDYKKGSEKIYSGAEVLKMNVQALMSLNSIKDKQIKNVIRDVYELAFPKYLVVTSSTNDTVLYDGLNYQYFNVPEVSNINEVGAGDIFIASLVARYKNGGNMSESIGYAIVNTHDVLEKRYIGEV